VTVNTGPQFNSLELRTVVIDLASIALGATVDVAVALPAGTMDAADRAKFIGAPALNHGLIVQGCHTPGVDTFLMRVSNVTGAAIDAAAIAFDFLILRRA
jgi:hypothetical protein